MSIPKLWDEVNKDGTVDLLLKLNNGEIKGVLGVCADNSLTRSNQVMDYWIATEYDNDTPEGLLKLEIPASKWAVFEVHGPMSEAIQKVWEQSSQNGFHPADLLKKLDQICNRLSFSIVLLSFSIIMVGIIIGSSMSQTIHIVVEISSR